MGTGFTPSGLVPAGPQLKPRGGASRASERLPSPRCRASCTLMTLELIRAAQRPRRPLRPVPPLLPGLHPHGPDHQAGCLEAESEAETRRPSSTA